MALTSKYLKYVKSWEIDPRLKDWIAPMAGDEKSAYCKVCRRPLYPHKKDLLLHSRSKKHAKNLEKYKELFSSCQPLKDADLGDGSYEINPSNIKLEYKGSFESPVSSNSSMKPTPKKNVTIALFSESQEIIQEEDIPKSLGEELNDTASIVISDDPSLINNCPYYSWKNIPEFRGWLEIDPETSNISCKVCCRDLKPNKTEVLKHSSGKLHKKKCIKNGIPVAQTEDDIDLSVLYSRESSLRKGKVIDLRSDTITQPSEEMKSAMMNAELGDDVFGDDPTVKELEGKVASLLEKECGLLAVSGTMANLIAVITHCWSRDSEVIVGDQSHLYRWSQGGLAKLGGIHAKPIRNAPDGTFSLDQLKALLDENASSSWLVQTLVCIENTHNRMGGRTLPLEWLEELGNLCMSRGVLLHMDGARILNASISCGASPSSLVHYCHSSTFCLNKGLGAPMGSVLVGSAEFIERAKRVRTMLGGTMHQAGIFSSAALYALESIAPKLHWDHANARAIAQAVHDSHSSAVTTDLRLTQTNFVHLCTDNIRVTPKDLCERLASIKDGEFHSIGEEVKLFGTPISDNIVRLVTHYDLSKCDIQLAIRKLNYVIEEYDNMLELNFDKERT